MASTTAASRARTSSSAAATRRSTASPPSSISITSAGVPKGATARSAVPSRGVSALSSPAARRASVTAASVHRSSASDTREVLEDALRHETEQKEQLLVKLQDKDSVIKNVTEENERLASSLNEAESRLAELYAEQARADEELSARIEVAEKLRVQVRELEREKRDIQRRYNEQATTFDAERQAFYDNEQHLKSRIQSLASRRRLATQASSQSLKSIQQPRKSLASEPSTQTLAEEPEVEEEIEEADEAEEEDPTALDAAEDEDEPAEMTALRLELSTLGTSHTSLQTTLNMLQSQLGDLQRVNHELQEENESYMILLREKTLSGNYDLVRQVGSGAAASDDGSDTGDSAPRDVDLGSIRSSERGTLELINEEPGEDTYDQDLENTLHAQGNISPTSAHGRNSSRRRGSSPPRIKGETLADLPVAGPGLDLAAELGRAENKDILEGNAIDDKERSPTKNKRGKKHSTEPSKISEGEVDALRNEVKSLKDANKALSLYASKILDRIISQEGFEHILAVDFEKPAPPPTPKSPLGGEDPQTAKPRSQPSLLPPTPTKKERRSTIMSPPQPASSSPASSTASPPQLSATTKASRRSMSFDWKSFSLFGGNNPEKKPETPNLRTLTLKPGNPTITGARKVETQEDEDDQRERERLSATMKLMGIEPALSPPVTATAPAVPSSPSPGMPPSSSNPTSPATSSSRWPFFRRGTSGSEQNSNASTPSLAGSRVGLGLNGEDVSGVGSLTQEALEQAEAENTLAALDAHERELSAEMAKGKGGGFTDIVPRRSTDRRRHISSGRSRTSGGRSSSSTVWSAGMSAEGTED